MRLWVDDLYIGASLLVLLATAVVWVSGAVGDSSGSPSATSALQTMRKSSRAAHISLGKLRDSYDLWLRKSRARGESPCSSSNAALNMANDFGTALERRIEELRTQLSTPLPQGLSRYDWDFLIHLELEMEVLMVMRERVAQCHFVNFEELPWIPLKHVRTLESKCIILQKLREGRQWRDYYQGNAREHARQ